jgi:predicted glycogen debranching enzyme
MASLFSPDVLQNWDQSSRLEWLVTNGIGGYASSTLSGANTRRYHGLLVAAFEPPVGRAVLLSKLEEEIRIDDQLYLLGANKYPSVVQPQGYRHLAAFTADPVPTFTYRFHEDSVELEKRIWMGYGRNTVYIEYRLIRASEPLRIRLLPLFAYKDYHSEQHRWDGFTAELDHDSGGALKFTAFAGAHPLSIVTEPAIPFSDHGGWFYNFEHSREQERGLDFTEDLYCGGSFDCTLLQDQTIGVIVTTESETPEPVAAAYKAAVSRRAELIKVAAAAGSDPARDALVVAADQFVIPKTDRTARATIMAGYHWFTDWGRDTMIALPGLCLTTCRFDVARDIIRSFSHSLRNGLLPNRFADGGGADYNTVDATLWYFDAIYRYCAETDDWKFASAEMLPTLDDILAHHIAGTDFGIHVDPADGLLAAGTAIDQLTWMDARVGDWVVTPRHGKPVEINALWHNALRVAADLHRKARNAKKAKEYEVRAAAVKEAFAKAFIASHGGLYDVIAPDGTPDGAVRPNQIFAASLSFPVLDKDQAKPVVDVVESVLLTPYGLRTLAPGSYDYKPHYGPGDQRTRDGAYHQGTVWPWLIGAFIDAHLWVYGDKARAKTYLETLVGEGMIRYGVGTLNEIQDAEAPYSPNGCIAQAWSVAEVLRAYSRVIG